MSCISTTRSNLPRLLAPSALRDLGCRGSAIVLVVSVGALVTMLVFTWVAFSVRRYHAVVDKNDGLHARYAAESVVSKAIYERMLNPQAKTDSAGALTLKPADTASQKFGLVGLADSLSADDSLTYIDSVHHSRATASLSEEGSFLRANAQGSCREARCEIDALFGLGMPPQFRYALIVTEQNRPLEIHSGRIIGDVHLASKPAGTIEGKVETPIESVLPKVAEEKFAEEVARLEGKISLPDSAETVFQGTQIFTENSPPPLHEGKSLFVNGNISIENGSNRPLVVKGPGTIVATGDIQISGPVTMDNVDILALGRVQCFDGARLQKVTVFSHSVIGFDDTVRCSGNFYAYEKIILAGQATVEMPSFAYVKGVAPKNSLVDFSGIEITQQSRFTGTAFCMGSSTSNTVSSIGRDARFTGLFYTHGQIVVEGTVFGCVAAALLREALVLREDNEHQKNILAGGTINRTALPKNFVVPSAFGAQGASFNLISWSEKMSRGTAAKDAGDE